MSDKHLVDQWREDEAAAGSRLEAWDDLTGLSLDPKGVLSARRQELDYIAKNKVWEVVPREEARRNGWKIINSRWIDINKGDDIAALYRSRLVGKEFADNKLDGLFAGTPPLEALRFLVHEAATVEGEEEEQEKVIMVNDVARAFFEAKAIRKLCVELPAECAEGCGGHNVGLLRQSLYGTRDAAMNWQEEVARGMRGWGFSRGQYNPCLYTHAERRVQVFLHGDDFASVGHRAALKAFLQELESRFEIKTSVIGTGVGEVREARVLNRIVRITELGWEYEPDQRHAEIIVEQLGLKDAKPVETPTEEEKKWEKEEDEKELDPDKQRHFRSIAARCNYIAADRPDLMFAVKCMCRQMAKPSFGAWKKLKRVGRYLVGKSRSILKYDWQGRETLVDGYTDSDWRGVYAQRNPPA